MNAEEETDNKSVEVLDIVICKEGRLDSMPRERIPLEPRATELEDPPLQIPSESPMINLAFKPILAVVSEASAHTRTVEDFEAGMIEEGLNPQDTYQPTTGEEKYRQDSWCRVSRYRHTKRREIGFGTKRSQS